ncbi:MAG: alpha amylase N-terminal ig-like domain-containing protein [Blautia sp.]|nr:alpha amylase N-terminal ig-like domain-containing protein [Blautia sp.]
MILEAIRHTGTYPDLYLRDRRTLVMMLRTAKKDADNCQVWYFSRTSPDQKPYRASQIPVFRTTDISNFSTQTTPVSWRCLNGRKDRCITRFFRSGLKTETLQTIRRAAYPGARPQRRKTTWEEI